MKRILVVSDTHGRQELLEEILGNEDAFDLVVHCGDIEGAEEEIFELTGPECALVMVPGNNDFFSSLPRERSFNIEGMKIWVTHGHHYHVSMDTAYIRDETCVRQMDMVMFGHTHKPLAICDNGVYLINPGSLTYPRQSGRQPSYIVMELQEGQDPKIEIKYV